VKEEPRKKTLLIIDDSDTVRRDMISILEQEGEFEQFFEAENGAEGLKVLGEQGTSIDVVACDINMPKLDGFSFLRMARANEDLASVPIVMVTSASEVPKVVKAFELGANDYIEKPFNSAILCARFTNMLHIKVMQDKLLEQKNIMERLATTDTLTNIPNLRNFHLRMEVEFAQAIRYGGCLSLLLADLDMFKNINDTYGHPQGDSVLRETAQTILLLMRKVDLVARYGGEEFVVLMPHTDMEGASNAAQRIRSAIEGNHFLGLGRAGNLTISIGVATFTRDMDIDIEKFIDEADKALYRAKENGRNRVELSPASVENMRELG